jgi:hypothetical protein
MGLSLRAWRLFLAFPNLGCRQDTNAHLHGIKRMHSLQLLMHMWEQEHMICSVQRQSQCWTAQEQPTRRAQPYSPSTGSKNYDKSIEAKIFIAQEPGNTVTMTPTLWVAT